MLKKYYLGEFFLVPIPVKQYQNMSGFAGVVYLNQKKVEKIYSERNATLLKLNLITAIEKQKKNKIITKCGYKKYRNKLTQNQICRILKEDTIQVSYDKWSEEVQNNIKEVEKICRQNPRKDIMQLKRQRKKLRAQYQNTENIDSNNRKNKTHKGTHNR